MILKYCRFILLAAALWQTASATIVVPLSFEELTDTSDVIASGRITRSWTAWDKNRKYIWTHYELSISTAAKGISGNRISENGASGSTIEFAEPGGALDGIALTIPGTVAYQPGESVLVFLQRMPNGYLRTTGWAQGRYGVGSDGRLQASGRLRDLEIKAVPVVSAGLKRTSLQTLQGMSLNEANIRITARIHAAATRGNAGGSAK